MQLNKNPYAQSVKPPNRIRRLLTKTCSSALPSPPTCLNGFRTLDREFIHGLYPWSSFMGYIPFNQKGGVIKVYQLFGDELDGDLDELTQVLVG